MEGSNSFSTHYFQSTERASNIKVSSQQVLCVLLIPTSVADLDLQNLCSWWRQKAFRQLKKPPQHVKVCGELPFTITHPRISSKIDWNPASQHLMIIALDTVVTEMLCEAFQENSTYCIAACISFTIFPFNSVAEIIEHKNQFVHHLFLEVLPLHVQSVGCSLAFINFLLLLLISLLSLLRHFLNHHIFRLNKIIQAYFPFHLQLWI